MGVRFCCPCLCVSPEDSHLPLPQISVCLQSYGQVRFVSWDLSEHTFRRGLAAHRKSCFACRVSGPCLKRP